MFLWVRITGRLSALKPTYRWHRLRLFVDQNFGKQLIRIADAEISS
jgi:hypothetical protein